MAEILIKYRDGSGETTERVVDRSERSPKDTILSMNQKFSAKAIVEPKSGKIHRVYSYDRKPCRRVILRSRLCEQLAGYFLIEKDLRSVQVWLAEIDGLRAEMKIPDQSFHAIDRERGNLIKGLFVAALTFYGKCFSKCEGRPVKLERAQLDERFRELHDECISYRHNFAAHSGAKKLEHVDIALVFPVKYKKEVPFDIFKELNQPDLFWPESGETSMFELIEHARSVADKKIATLLEKIKNEEVLPHADKYWPRK